MKVIGKKRKSEKRTKKKVKVAGAKRNTVKYTIRKWKWKAHEKESESCWQREKKTLKYTIRKWNFVEKEKNWSIQKESETFWQIERNWEATKSKWKLLTKSKNDDQKVRSTHKSMEILQRNRSAVSNFYGRGKVKNILWNDLVKS